MPFQLPTSASHTELQAAWHLAIAGLVGLAVGTEREWSGHASGPNARFAGVRTFLLLGLLGGTSGLLLGWGMPVAGAALLGGGALLVAVAYAMAVRREGAEIDGTTEGAALVVLALGAVAGLGQLMLAGGAAAVVVLALGEKERLHWLVRRIGEREMRAALQYAVLALVILPVLPEGPYGPWGGIRPRALWGLVVLLSGINFAGYLARRAVGASRGYQITGLLGGLVSSTVVTLQFARLSRDEPEEGRALGLGVVGACTVLALRVALIVAMLEPSLAVGLVPYVVPTLLAGGAIAAVTLRHPGAPAAHAPRDETRSPLRLWSAIQMTLLFQVAITVMSLVRDAFGTGGVLASAVVFGLTDMDALTVSMVRLAQRANAAELAALGIAVGILSNTVFKTAIALVVGTPRFRRVAASGLAVLALALGVGIWWGMRV